MGRSVLAPGYSRKPSSFGDHLGKKRLDLGVCQKDVAKRLGADEVWVNSWENNLKTPSLRFMPGITAFLGYCPCDVEPRSLGKSIVLTRRLMGLGQKKLPPA